MVGGSEHFGERELDIRARYAAGGAAESARQWGIQRYMAQGGQSAGESERGRARGTADGPGAR